MSATAKSILEQVLALPTEERREIADALLDALQPRVASGLETKVRGLQQLEAVLQTLGGELAPRVEELAEKSTEGRLTPDETREYEHIVELSDKLSVLKLEAEALWSLRAAS